MAIKRRKFLPENVIELLFGVGASIVIIGALLKITHSDFIFTGNDWLTVGLVVEAIIFSISGIQGYMTGDSSVEDAGLQTIEAETQSLQQAVDQTVSGLSSLNKNLSAATAATESFNVPKDINENLNSYNDNLSSIKYTNNTKSLIWSTDINYLYRYSKVCITIFN